MTFYPKAVQQPSMYSALMQGLQGYQAVKGIQQQEAAGKRAESAEQRAASQQDIQDRDRFDKESSQFAATIRGMPADKKIQRIQARITDLDERGIPSDTTKRLLDMYQQGTTGVQRAGSIEEAEMLSAKMTEADEAIEQRYQMGVQRGYVKAPEKEVATGYRPATAEDKQMFNITDKAPYAIGPKGKPVRLGGKGQTINVSTGIGDTGTFKKQMARSQVKHYDDIQEQAAGAEESLQDIQSMRRISLETGKAQPIKQMLGAWGRAFGIDTSSLANVPAGEAFQAAQQKLVNNILLQAKGIQTEGDAQRAAKIVANRSNHPKTNDFIWNNSEAALLRKREHGQFMDNWLANKGNLDGARKEWKKHIREVPMISRNIADPDGFPVFFHIFEKTMKERNPGMSRKDIIDFWKEKDKAAKKVEKQPQIPIESLPKPIPLSMNARVPQEQLGKPSDQLRQGLSGRYGL